MQSPGSFSAKLAAVMASRQMGARTLAKLIDPANVEQARKSVRRWLRGTQASQVNRDVITDALGLERGALDPDAEEESLNAALWREMQETRAKFERIEALLGEKVA
jgi:hypothetical protein